MIKEFLIFFFFFYMTELQDRLEIIMVLQLDSNNLKMVFDFIERVFYDFAMYMMKMMIF